MERLARSLATVPVGLQVAATVGLILIVQAGARLTFGSAPLFFPRYLPVGTVEVAGVVVSYEQIVPMAVALLATLALAVFFSWSRLGVAMRGVVDDPTLLAMTGTSPIAVRRVAWIVGSIFVCLSGVLLAPSVNLDSMVLTLLVVQSFGAAAIGRFSNIPLTYVGGLGDRGDRRPDHPVREWYQRLLRRPEPELPVHRAVRRPDRDAAVEAGGPPDQPGPARSRSGGLRPGCRWSERR